jgi:hypothetical protein
MRGSIRHTVLLAAATAICGTVAGHDGSPPEPASTDLQLWATRAGVTTISFDRDALAAAGLSIAQPDTTTAALADSLAWQVAIKRESTLTFSTDGESVGEILGGHVLHLGDLTLVTPNGRFVLSDPTIAPAGGDDPFNALWVVASPTGEPALVLRRVKAGFDPQSRMLTVQCGEVRISSAMAERMGDAMLADVVLGDAIMRSAVAWVGGAKPEIAPDEEPHGHGQAGAILAEGCDMTFCQLYGMYQPARQGDIVALSVATTSWGVGTADCIWFNIPDEEHPFIVMNVYRLMDDRFEQLGQSHIKHGFYALGSHQCGGPPCQYEPGHSSGNWLGQNCTDTYSAPLNAVQSGMGPKYEVNPWTGYWYYPGSHMQGSHSHDNIQHRIQVYDADLDPAQNPGATYFGEGYYVMLDDVNVMNSTAWKTMTVSGVPGGTYSFGMSGSSTFPNIGFALDAWPGATVSTVAQEIPVQEFISPDGRCLWASKATDLGDGTWHYEYALLNIDMDRQVGSVSITLPPATTVTNIGFHAVHHHDEPFNTVDPDAVPIDNAPWNAVVSGDAITWSTTTNPVRWSMLYNFRFDANVAPEKTDHTFGLFRPGTPSALMATGKAPTLECFPDFDNDGEVAITDFLALLGVWGSCAGCDEDLNGDDEVGVQDFLLLLAWWGTCP